MNETDAKTGCGTPPDPRDPPAGGMGARSELVPVSNALLYLAFCLLAGSGLALELRLGYRNATLLGRLRADWVDFHRMVALTFVSLSMIHVWVNLPWLRATWARLRWSTVIVALLGLAALAAFLFAPVF